MLMPSNTKYRKQMRRVSRMLRTAQKGNTVSYGDFGLRAMESKWITNKQIESVRIAINREFKRAGKVFIRIFPDKPFTKKPAEVRMGSGKGGIEGWVAPVKKGTIMFEVAEVTEEQARRALRKATFKLPIFTEFVKKESK